MLNQYVSKWCIKSTAESVLPLLINCSIGFHVFFLTHLVIVYVTVLLKWNHECWGFKKNNVAIFKSAGLDVQSTDFHRSISWTINLWYMVNSSRKFSDWQFVIKMCYVVFWIQIWEYHPVTSRMCLLIAFNGIALCQETLSCVRCHLAFGKGMNVYCLIPNTWGSVP